MAAEVSPGVVLVDMFVRTDARPSLGAGNLTPDTQPYADGEIVREGVQGVSTDGGAFSTGVGGAGNIAAPGVKPSQPRADGEVVPETAVRKSLDEPHHFGRGGAGNEDRTPEPEGHKEDGQAHVGLADKLKAKITGHSGTTS
ncbi:MAG: hypothetical protein M1824_004801 [Vezdaea acicularis]|nr:MAG: hypothetical protein M1824_004801 [Vezdaea acicularis]